MAAPISSMLASEKYKTLKSTTWHEKVNSLMFLKLVRIAVVIKVQDQRRLKLISVVGYIYFALLDLLHLYYINCPK